MDEEKFDAAVASIEAIPEEDRDQDCLVHLVEAWLLANADYALRAAR